MRSNVFYGPDLIIPSAKAVAKETARTRPIHTIRHPEYDLYESRWRKWRLTYRAGDDFVEAYLEKFSLRESPQDFLQRRKVTPVPAFAKAAVNDIKNGIFQRMVDTTRKGGPRNYQEAIAGNNGGINRRGGSMNWFIGDEILPELLTMKKVGVYVDSPPSTSSTSQRERSTVHPYLYRYNAEDILCWAWRTDTGRQEFSAILLRDYADAVDPVTHLPFGLVERFRLLWVADDGVHVQFLDAEGNKEGSEIVLNLRRIPFVVFEISDSLLCDAASYQIALLNIESSDIGFVLKSNFPFYTEQRNNTENTFKKQPEPSPGYTILPSDPTTLIPYDPTAACYPNNWQGDNIDVGTMHGRQYPTGSDRPEFIAPPTEPLEASMKKQVQMKEDIRLLVNLALSNIKPQMASAESKAMDQAGLESGLSYIGLELEHGERQIAEIWAEYEQQPAATIKYPERYTLKTDEEQRKEIDTQKANLFTVPSENFRKEVLRRIAAIMLGSKISAERLEAVYRDIDSSPMPTLDPDILDQHMKASLVSPETVSKAVGYPPEEFAKAAEAHIARLKAIAISQGAIGDAGARGVVDLAVDPDASAKEKVDKPQRGPE